MIDLRRNMMFFVLLSFAFMSFFGMSMGMEIMGGQMSSCPFMMGQAAMCHMDVAQHIAKWQQAFLGIPTQANILAFAILLFAIVIFFIRPFFQLEELTKFVARLYAYHKAHLLIVCNPLLGAFSDGILNPKIYESAHI